MNKVDRDRVFISYSHDDRDWLQRLQKHLRPYVRATTISIWDDTQIPTGGKWRENISAALASARVGVLLVSPSYLASDFIAEQELPPLIEAAQSGELVIVWIPVSASSVHRTPIFAFQSAWSTAAPLDLLSESEQNKALVQICDSIERAFTRQHNLTPSAGANVTRQFATSSAAEVWSSDGLLADSRRDADLAIRLPRREPTAAEIADGFRKLSSPVLDLVVPAEKWIARPEEEHLRRLLAEIDTRGVCLLGGPGSGKTALLARIALELSQAGSLVVAIKADLISPEASLSSWARGQVELDIELIDGIMAVSPLGKVAVVIDQLDALASLADVKPERLNDLVELIRQCRDIPNVTVVCSCRELEYRRDTRLNHLDLDSVTLDLPSWEQVSCQLKKAGIAEPDLWPASFREVLRTPQHLHVYLERFLDTGQPDVFVTYQQMLDDLWRRRIHTPERRDFVDRLTKELMDRESLWAPAVLFEDDERIVDEMEREEVIQRQDLHVSFRHQTLLEHAKARWFTKSGQSLADHVLARQDAIFVRPTIWSVLRYLRGADPAKYRREIETLMHAELRLHVRFLLIDFLGQVSDPEEFEVLLLAERLARQDDGRRVLIAIRGNERWFHALRSTHFPTVMRWELPDVEPMIGVIEDAWHFAHDDCLRLVEHYWLADPGRDELTWRALHEIDRWEQRAVDAVRRVIRRAKGGRLWWAEDIVYLISAEQPQLAPQVVAEVLERNLRGESDGLRGSCPEGEASFKLPRSMHSPLESSGDWHELAAVAEATPVEFLRSIWPWFTRVAVEYHSGSPSSVIQEYGGWALAFDRAQPRRHHPLADSILTAVERAAASEPQAFLEITRFSWEIENGPIQNLLARGLAAAAPRLPNVALDFLCSDPRRFLLGEHGVGEQANSIALIAAVAPYLDEPGLGRLEETILSWTRYRPDVEITDRHEAAERKARLRLLKAIPEALLTSTTATFVRREEAELPDWDRKPRQMGGAGRLIEIPPLTKNQMISGTDEQILAVLRGDLDGDYSRAQWCEDDGVWVQPGGALSGAREVAALAKEVPERVLTLVPKLVVDGSESAAAAVLRDIGSTDLTDEDVFRLVRESAAVGATTEDFRSDAACLLRRHCREKTGLPEEICGILERWLAMPWASDNGDSAVIDGVDVQENRELVSVLWASEPRAMHADRSFWPLLAATYGYLMRVPPATNAWLEMVERHLDRDISERTWIAFCSELHWIELNNCDRERGVAVVRKLFDKFPSIRTEPEGIRLVACVAYLLPDDFLRWFLDGLGGSASPQTREGFGELLTLIALRDAEHGWAVPLLDQQLRESECGPATAAEPIAIGIAYAAAHLWDEPAVRRRANRLLCQLIPHAAGRVFDAIGTVFWAQEDFPADRETETLLQTLADHPNALGGRNVADLVAHLAKLLPHQRGVVLAVCQAVVERRGPELTSISYELFSAGPHLVNISMTLQRFPDTKSDGLALLETLLRLGIDDAFAVLREVDIRPGSARRREPRKRRRRKRT